MTTTIYAPAVPVIAVWPVIRQLRRRHSLPAAATAAVVERYQGRVCVCCTNLDAPNGTKAAAQAWAHELDAAYAGAGAP